MLSPAAFHNLLRRIDTAVHADLLADCVLELGGSEHIQNAIYARRQMISSLSQLREHVQNEWVRQQIHYFNYEGYATVGAVNDRYAYGTRPSVQVLSKWASELLVDRPGAVAWGDCRHVFQGRHGFSGETLATRSLLYGEGKASHDARSR